MTLWRLEWLRLIRTRRAIALAGVYAFFGLLGPLTARYLKDIIDRFGSGEIQVIVPDPVPADGMAQFAANATQIGLLVAVVVAAGALTLDAIPEMAVFLRTRVRPTSRLLIPRYTVTLGAVAGASVLGTGLAWYETTVLIGALPANGVLTGIACSIVYLAFAVAVTASLGARMSSTVGTIVAALVVLLVLPLVGIVDAIGRWLPSHLVGAQAALAGEGAIGEYLGAAAIALAATGLLLVDAARSLARREL